MQKMSIITIGFGIGVIVIAILANLLWIDVVAVPEIDTTTLETVEPSLDQSFVEDLQARSQNYTGIELEL